jgi:hypothetical protein
MCPALSKSQQQAMGIAYAVKTGKLPKSKLKGASKNMAKMSTGDLEHFAKTKHKGLPKYKKHKAKKVNETLYERFGLKVDLYVDIIMRWLENKGFSDFEINTILEDPFNVDLINDAEYHGLNPIVIAKELNTDFTSPEVNEEQNTGILNAENIDFYVNKLLKNLESVANGCFLFVKGSLNLRPSITLTFALGGSEAEWPNRIIHNDVGHMQFMIHTDPNRGASLSLLTRNFKQKTAGIKTPRQVAGNIDKITDYLIKYLLETIPQIKNMVEK